MKFTMNGSIILGTMDGATVEIVPEIGRENAFIFGAQVGGDCWAWGRTYSSQGCSGG